MVAKSTDYKKADKQFLSLSEAAMLAGFSNRHFRRIIDRDGIPIMRIGRRFFLLARDFEYWISHKETEIPRRPSIKLIEGSRASSTRWRKIGPAC